MRIAAVGDLHCSASQRAIWAPLIEPVNDEADVLLLAGDLTLCGELEELRVLLDELAVVQIPIVAVLGNHDFDSGRARVIGERLRRAGIHYIEAAGITAAGISVVGAVGGEGGFSRERRTTYGERQIKARLQHYLEVAAGMPRVVLLHYAPITGTLAGENPRLWPLLGSAALGEAIDAGGADMVLHGHAHYGCLEGKTDGGIPVFNVALPVLEREGYTRPYRVFEV